MEAELVTFRNCPALEKILHQNDVIAHWAKAFHHKEHAIFIGRGDLYPIALEGALKMKEISYIHAEGYPAGELKHGPLALIDTNMPVIAIMPGDELLEKNLSNLQEIRARGGKLYVLTDQVHLFHHETFARRACDCDATRASAACAHSVYRPAAIAGVSRCCAQRHGRRSTPQSSQSVTVE